MGACPGYVFDAIFPNGKANPSKSKQSTPVLTPTADEQSAPQAERVEDIAAGGKEKKDPQTSRSGFNGWRNDNNILRSMLCARFAF